MTDQAINGYESTGADEQSGAEVIAEHRGESLLTFLGFVFLLIMPLGIVFHPEWLATLAEVGTVVAAVCILRLTREPKA